MAKTQSAGLGAGSRPYGLGAPAMQATPPGFGGTPSSPMGTQPGGALGTPGITPPGVPPQFANIWHLLPPQLQAILGGQSPVGGLLGGQQSGLPGGILGLLQQQQQQATPPHMQASGNPYPVPQSYQTPSTPLAGATFGPGQGASGNPYPVRQEY